jgi:3-phenylpropionate/cinnamic acid dioxygenase small subunit
MKITAVDRTMMMNDLADQAFRCWLAIYADERLYSVLPEQYRRREKLELQARSTNALDC